MKQKFNVLEKKYKGANIIELEGGTFDGRRVVFDDVQIKEENDEARLTFAYEMADGVEAPSSDEFKDTLGEVLTTLIEEALDKHEVIYKGGV